VKLPGEQRREIFYSGHVQGVGFRYSVCHLAQQYEISGFVRNLPDGRVQVVIEGVPKEIRGLSTDIAQKMEHYIRSTKVSDLEATGEFEGFGIRF
jgi:acylphosphatase